MFFGILTLVTALAISGVAIYYSVAGLAAIFAAAVIPIVIMGGVLEVSKLVTAVWLHRYWNQATWWLKTYLTTAVVVLMFITSMGIFGFLSNAHVQQTALGNSTQAQLERIQSEIARQQAIISRSEDKIETVTAEGIGADSNLQSQIDREQARIDKAYERAEPAIQEQQVIIERLEGRILEQIEAVDDDIDRLENAISQEDIAAVQSIVGVPADGIFGPNTRDAVQTFRDRKAQEKARLEERLANVADNPRIQAARQEIERIRNRVEQEVAQSNELINRLRAQLGTSTGEDIDSVIDEQNQRITNASQTIDSLTEEQFEIESQVRQLEAEVGPIKYIAEFVYGEDADKNLLEEAVRWVIVIIIFVFDPLAVLLLIASQYTFRWHGRDIIEYEPNQVDSQEPLKNSREETTTTTDEDEIFHRKEEPTPIKDIIQEYLDLEPPVENSPAEKKDTESWEELQEISRQQVIEEQEDSVHWQEAKKLWKQDHPDLTIKDQKQKFLNGEIDSLPWEDYLSNEEEAVQKKRKYMTKKNGRQVRKQTS